MTGILRCRQGQSWGSEPVTCGADAVQEDSAGTGSNVWDAQLVSENRWGAWEKTHACEYPRVMKTRPRKACSVTAMSLPAATSGNSPNAQRVPDPQARCCIHTTDCGQAKRRNEAEMKARSQRGACTPVLAEALFTTATSGDQPGIRH